MVTPPGPRRARTARRTRDAASRAIFCNVASLQLTIRIELPRPSLWIILDAPQLLASAPIRMPPFDLSSTPMYRRSQRLVVDCELSGDKVVGRFDGVVATPTFETLARRFHRDFWKALFVSIVLCADGGAVPFHAACARGIEGLCLIVGGSGSGKSSLARAAAEAGDVVVASELVFAAAGEVVAGNLVSDMPHTFGRTAVESMRDHSADLYRPGMDGVPTATVTTVVFPRLRGGELRARTINSARARALLFENVMSMTGIATLVGHDTVPMGVELRPETITRIVHEVETLAEVPSYVCEGEPTGIWRFCREPHTPHVGDDASQLDSWDV